MKPVCAMVLACSLIAVCGHVAAQESSPTPNGGEVAGIGTVGTVAPSADVDNHNSSQLYSAHKDAEGRDVYETSTGTFTQLPQNVVDAPGPDGPSKADLAAQGILFLDRTSSDIVKQTAPHHYELTFRSSDGKQVTLRAETAGLVDPSVSVEITSTGDLITYTYTFANGKNASQAISSVGVVLPRKDIILESSDHAGWMFVHFGGSPRELADTRAAWLPLGQTPLLGPSQTIGPLSISSKYWPGLTDALFPSVANKPFDSAPPEELPERAERFLLDRERAESDVRRVTVGPVIAPPDATEGARAAVVEQLSNDVDKARNAGLIDAAAADVARDVLKQAAINVATPVAFEALAATIANVEGIDASYQQGIVWVLRALGNLKAS